MSSTSASAFKKTRRTHHRTTENRNDQGVNETWTPFRATEKKYKARFPPPDLSGVLDLDALAREPGIGEVSKSSVYTLPRVPGLVLLPSFVSPADQRSLVRWALQHHARHPNETNLDAHYNLPPQGLWNAHLESRPPLIKAKAASSAPSAETSSGPRKLISNEGANSDNLHALQAIPKPPPEPSPTVSDLHPSQLVRKLRWANIGWSYHWGTKQYDFSKGKGRIDPRVRDLCKKAVCSVPWHRVFGEHALEGWGDDDWRTWHDNYEPDAGIVNYYQTKDTLMAHVDRSEVCATSPLVSISLGNAAIFLIGGLTRDVEPAPILLRSGDALIMAGPACRRAYHGVPRVLENTIPEHFSEAQPLRSDGGGKMAVSASESEDAAAWQPYRTYMENARININVRQVFPTGFVPAAHQDLGAGPCPSVV